MHTNRLVEEKSPYLLQHAHNPVDWFPWCEAAFEKAREEDKPVFLSIGYATCHWCHVMERESFENEEVAALLNEAFVCIKVDREERPDIDEIYMTVCQLLTRSGGWPLTIVMKPDQTPFFAATYIPAETRLGRMGLMELIPRIADSWKNRRDDVIHSAREITAMLTPPVSVAAVPEVALCVRTLQELEENFDATYGGFGGAPKFPLAHRLIFLIRQHPQQVRSMVENTLRAMRCGGIWDHLGCGIHRYATDREWLVPHFEKMLYDQAQTAFACTEAFEAYGDKIFHRMAEEIFEYVLRDMTAPDGGFYSAEDADSEGVEGKFYFWTLDELRSVLTPDELALVVKRFNVRPDGNFRDEASGQKTGENILHGYVGSDCSDALRKKLFAVREERIHPLKDTKVLTDWNGLMIAALAKAARAFGAPEYEVAACRAADFIWNEMQKNGRLMHRWREGHIAVPGQLTDYAFFISGLLELYETTFDSGWLDKALMLNQTVTEHFCDAPRGGFYQTADDAEPLLIRPKSLYDGAVPSGNSVQMMNLLKLSRLTGQPELEALTERTIRAFATELNRFPSGFTQALQALQFMQGDAVEAVIVGDRNAPDTLELIQAIRSVYCPYKSVLLKESGIERLAPLAGKMELVDGHPAVYLCRNLACKAPLIEATAVRAALKR